MALNSRRRSGAGSGTGRLRIVAGAARGRILSVPKGRSVRPTPDRAREALFSILGDRCLDARVLDPCAGSGALGLEALSRGALEVTLIELDRRTVETLRENIERVGLEGVRLEVGDCRAVLARLAGEETPPFDLVLLDPPFKAKLGGAIAEHVVELELLSSAGFVVVEHPSKEMLPTLKGLREIDQRQYGTVAFDFFELE
jgi:16S rRNA (guanine966-N2)-methyltransferase